jgi:PAS domain S-box-containing protein
MGKKGFGRASRMSVAKMTPSAETFAAMADNLPELAWMTDPVGGVIWYNKRWYDYTGTTLEQMQGWGWRSIHDPAELPETERLWKESLESGKPFEMTFSIRGSDGVLRPFLTRAHPLRDASGRITAWFGVNTDIGRLQAASRDLSEQKRVAETLNRTAAKVAAELNLEAMVQIVVDAAVELTGAQFGAFFYNVIKPSGEAYTLYSISGVPRENFSKFPMPRNTQVFEPTFRGAGIVRSADITKDPRYGHNTPHKGMPEGHLPVRSYLAAPVMSRHGEVMGGLFFGHSETGVFSAHDEQLVEGLAAQAAIGIDNSRLFAKAEREIAERKQAEEARTLVLRELNHRVKNLFAVAAGMVTMTARTSQTTSQMAETLSGRLRALARAHELIRASISADSHELTHTTLRAMTESILEPHVTPGGAQLTIDGPDVPVGPTSATSLALILHEFATNAAKYGALTEPSGKVSIVWKTEGGDLLITWAERGGPKLEGPPTRKGFGADLARTSARGQLGGDVTYDWKAEGVTILIRVSLERLAA